MTPEIAGVAGLAWNQLWQVTVVALVVGALARLADSKFAHLGYLLWMLIIVKCLAPPIWSSPTGVFSWAATRATVPASATKTGTESHAALADARNAESASSYPYEPAVPDSEPGSRRLEQTVQWTTGLEIVWLVGFLACSGALVARRISYARLLRRSRILASERLMGLVAGLTRRLRVRRKVRVFVTSMPLGPAVYGLLRPTLVLPEWLMGKPREEIEPVLAHELIHVRRGDIASGLAQLVAQVVWWFHPLVWWANRHTCRQRECCCDEEVLATLRCDPAHYAQMLLDVLRRNRQLHPVFALSSVGSARVTLTRLEKIMNPASKIHRRTPPWCWAIAILAAILVLPGRPLVYSGAISEALPAEGQNAANAPRVVSSDLTTLAAAPEAKAPNAPVGSESATAQPPKRAATPVKTKARPPDVMIFKDFAVSTPAALTDDRLAGLESRRPRPTVLALNDTAITDAGLLHLKALTNLETLVLSGTKVTDAGLIHLKHLTRLKSLILRNTAVTDTGVENLTGLAAMRRLDLTGSRVTVAGVLRLAQTLPNADISASDGRWSSSSFARISWSSRRGEIREGRPEFSSKQVTDAGLAPLAELANLKVLDLLEAPITDAGLTHLKGLTGLEELFLGRSITDAGLVNLKGLTGLVNLRLHGSKITDAGLANLASLTNLKRLDLNFVTLNGSGLVHLNSLNRLESLVIETKPKTTAALPSLSGLTQLRWLFLVGIPLTDADFAQLRALKSVQSLTLVGAKASDVGLMHLAELKNLRQIEVISPNVTEKGIETLERALPQVSVAISVF